MCTYFLIYIPNRCLQPSYPCWVHKPITLTKYPKTPGPSPAIPEHAARRFIRNGKTTYLPVRCHMLLEAIFGGDNGRYEARARVLKLTSKGKRR